MQSNYRGESPSKKLARISLWSHIEDRLGLVAFRRGPHLVIASQEAGDVSTLLAMGVKPSAIHAVDIDPHAISAAKRKFWGRGVKFVVADFKDAHTVFDVPRYASAFIDMCAPIREATLERILRLKARVTAYEFLCGREKGNVATYLEWNKSHHPARARLDYLSKYGFETAHCIYYNSFTLTTIGMPMCIAIGGKGPYRIEELRYNEKQLRADLVKSKNARHDAGLYNVNFGTVAAWKAWETRGAATSK